MGKCRWAGVIRRGRLRTVPYNDEKPGTSIAMRVSDKIERVARYVGPAPERLSTPPKTYAILCLVLTIVFGGLMFLRPVPWAPLFLISVLYLVIWTNRAWRARSDTSR